MTATRAREVIGPEMEEERMTWRKGWRRDGVSKVVISGFCQWGLRRRGAGNTFATCEVRSEFGEGCYERIILVSIRISQSSAGASGRYLYALALLASKAPPIRSRNLLAILLCPSRSLCTLWRSRYRCALRTRS